MSHALAMPIEGPSPARERYNAGLGNLRIYIETKLEDTGAKMGTGSIFHPAWPARGEAPEKLKVFIVPFNASGMRAVFSREEICACHKGVVRADVRAKVKVVVDRFVNYRANATFGMLGARATGSGSGLA